MNLKIAQPDVRGSPPLPGPCRTCGSPSTAGVWLNGNTRDTTAYASRCLACLTLDFLKEAS